jgi:hypothetical protein
MTDPQSQPLAEWLEEHFECQDERHNKFTVGELLDAINQTLNPDVTTEQLLAVARIGKTLLYESIWIADQQDNAEFFEMAYSYWGPLVTAVQEECDLSDRDTRTGHRLERQLRRTL